MGLLVPTALFASGASAQTTEDVEVRDQLIANQEALLNVYRCRFNIDTQVVPGGCTNGVPSLPAPEPVPFGGNPTSEDIATRDNLVEAQESLLNVYRCRFNIDTQIVPGGCPNGEQPTPVPTEEPPESTGAWELVQNDGNWAGIRLMASSTENYSGNTPHMEVWCRADGQAIWFSVTFPDERLEGAGAYWLNGDRHSASNWVAIGNNDQTVRWEETRINSRTTQDVGHANNQSWFRDTLFKMIENPGTFRLQANDDSTTPPAATFELAGLPEAIKPVRETCGI